ncbi:MAG: futalosine hydrolase, partial [Saprospiraceae bacterium]|nr:futalosine hydrolase [Saprospiraceae bacterium]
TFDDKLQLGDVVQVVSERFADLGVEEADGSFTDLFELGLLEPDQFPFSGGVLKNERAGEFKFLPSVRGLTVNKVHGSSESIARISGKYVAEIESMEGAAFFYACLQAKINFIEIRSISNYVEPRNRDNWQVELAVQRLNEVLISLLKNLP